MAPHRFLHAGIAYDVEFHRMDGQWFAVLYAQGYEHGRALHPFPSEMIGGGSEDAIRAGFIGVAIWLVKTGRFSPAEPFEAAA